MKAIVRLWKTLGKSIYVGNRLKANLLALVCVSMVTFVLGAVLTVNNIIKKDVTMLIPSLLTLFGGLGCGLFAGVLKKRKIAALFPAAFCTVMFTIYALTGMGKGTAILWSLMMPIGLCYFVSVRFGIVCSFYHLVLYSVLFYSPLRAHFTDYYTETFMFRFPMLFAGVAFFTIIAMVQYHRSALYEIEYADTLNEEVKKQTKVATERAEKLERLSEEVVETLARTIDAKDKYTNGHSFRVTEYSVALARHMHWSDEQIALLRREALLHDIGKIGVPDAVLNKPDKLTDEEFDIIRSHTTIGQEILSGMKNIEDISSVAVHHHERYDGKGYPSKLAGTDIPLHARVVSIADAFDAMNSDRIYRKAMPKERIREELVKGRGTQFDPTLLDNFLEIFDAGEVG